MYVLVIPKAQSASTKEAIIPDSALSCCRPKHPNATLKNSKHFDNNCSRYHQTLGHVHLIIAVLRMVDVLLLLLMLLIAI